MYPHWAQNVCCQCKEPQNLKRKDKEKPAQKDLQSLFDCLLVFLSIYVMGVGCVAITGLSHPEEARGGADTGTQVRSGGKEA